VLVVMAVYTEVFPVRPVRGIVFVVTVLVVYGEEMAVLVIELAGTLGADKAVNAKRLFPVFIGPGGGPDQISYDLVSGLPRFPGSWHRPSAHRVSLAPHGSSVSLSLFHYNAKKIRTGRIFPVRKARTWRSQLV
jgi:hypothetical protein